MKMVPKAMASALVAYLTLVGLVSAAIYTVDNAPSLDTADTVQFYYLSAPFPYNAPSDIVATAGSAYNSYATNHGGLGVWDTTSDVKFTIEFVSEDYVGSLLPDLDNGAINWKNAGRVVITDPLVEANWLSARLITTTIGSAYSQIITYLQDNDFLFDSYQPITGMYLNSSSLNTSLHYSNTELYTMGNVLVTNRGSYWFLDLLVNQLGTYGCDLESFLAVYASASSYLSDDKVTPSTVSWASPAAPNAEVYAWYQDLTTCYSAVYSATAANGQGAEYFLSAVKTCYGDFAYIFLTNTSVYNITLGNYTESYATPLVSQYLYELPPDDSGHNERLSVLDYVVISLAAIAVLAGAGYFLYRFFGKKKRRHISFEGERVATNIAGPLAELDHEDRAYYQ